MRARTFPSTKFNRDELRALAVAGAQARAEAMERELARLHREFPELFATETPPVFTKAEPKANGKDWPIERRTAQAARMKKQQTKLQAGRRKAMKMPARIVRPAHLGKPARRTQTGPPIWQRVQAFLADVDGHRATNKQMKQALGVTDAAIATLVKGAHASLFRRVEPGVYELSKAGLNGAAG